MPTMDRLVILAGKSLSLSDDWKPPVPILIPVTTVRDHQSTRLILSLCISHLPMSMKSCQSFWPHFHLHPQAS